jgi:hypothetical protein
MAVTFVSAVALERLMEVSVGAVATERHPVQVAEPNVSVTVTFLASVVAVVLTVARTVVVVLFTTVSFRKVTPVPDTFALRPVVKAVPEIVMSTLEGLG